MLFTILEITLTGQSLANTGITDATMALVGTAILNVAGPEPGVAYAIILAHNSVR
jgi:hypothetical protein